MTAAFKFLRPGRIGPFTGAQWPLPGQWLESPDRPELCRSGVHAIRASVLPKWMTEELWRVELDDEAELGDGILIAPRGRLIEQVVGWNDDIAREYGEACIARLSEDGPPIAQQRRVDALAMVANVVAGTPAAAVGYIAAKAAEARSPGGYTAERQQQAVWLCDRLGLSA